jgi:hypothetical protein
VEVDVTPGFGPSALRATLVIGFTLSRLVHALGMKTTIFQARRIGAGVTYLFEVGAILAILPYGILRQAPTCTRAAAPLFTKTWW